jgi:hypothetical protein
LSTSLEQAVNNLYQACWYYQTCSKVVPTSPIQSWYKLYKNIVQGRRSGSKRGGGYNLAPAEGWWPSREVESLKCHFLHFRRRFTEF